MKRTDHCDAGFYKIPSDAVIKNRKKFYSLQKVRTEAMAKWLNRLQRKIARCKFGRNGDVNLIDKFFCELSKREILQFGHTSKWSVAKLIAMVSDHENFDGKSIDSSKSDKTPTNGECDESTDDKRKAKRDQPKHMKKELKKDDESNTEKIETRSIRALRKQSVNDSNAIEIDQASLAHADEAKTSKRSRNIGRHRTSKRDSENDNIFICDICQLVLSTKSILKRHLEAHRPLLKRLQCKKCPKTCSNKYNYELHYRRRHGNGKPPKPERISETAKDLKSKSKSYRCSICGLFLSTKFNLKRHKAIHQANVERLKCLDCGITCSNKFNYQEHCLRRHKQKPPRKPKPVLEPSKFPFRFNVNINKE